jgi:hypothetical protein
VPRRVGYPVVREGGDAEAARADSPDGFEHARTRHARLGDLRHELPAVHREAARAAVGLEGRIEGLHRELAPLEPRPGTCFTRRDHHAVDRVGLDPVRALVSRDGMEWRVLHDAADVEDHRRDRSHA